MKLLILCALVAMATAFDFPEQWTQWKTLHAKVYTTELEELRRHTVWQANKKFVDEHNAVADKFGYTLTVNEFSDLESAEFARIYNGYRPAPRNNATKLYQPSPTAPLAATVDWRNKGIVTPVKNQGQCGSCWAFSTTGSMEGQDALKTGRLISLSEQELVDCSRSYGNQGCSGGLMDSAFRFIIANRGDDTESSYPYEARNGQCRSSMGTVGGTITSYKDIPRGSESALQSASMNIGPISVAIDASHRSFQMYQGGVYYEPSCSTSRLDHGVLVVGYGTENGQDYWLVKNSWGPNWGLQGYLMMSRNRGNNCGIATSASYPIA